jgi:hypothetical protein
MKTYLLRPAPPVQRQTRRAAKPTVDVRPEPCHPPVRPGPALFIGLDVHTDSIAVSLAPSDGQEVRRYGQLGGEAEDPF